MNIKDAKAWARLEPAHTAQGAVFHALLTYIEELEEQAQSLKAEIGEPTGLMGPE